MKDNARILVIDDEPGICEGIRRALQPEGFQVEIALDGRFGLSRVQEQGFDLALIDVKMPEISGLDLIPMIHEIDPEMICIIITGYATVEMAVAAIKEGAYDFLTKPFSVDTLLLAVNQGLERRMLSREAKKAARAEREAQKLVEEKARLEELDQAKKQFIRLVTHELQAPIAAVENYLQLIQEGYVPPEKQREVICKCITRAEEERVLINDLLELGRLESDVNHVDELANVPGILLEVLEDCRETIKEKNLNLVKKVNGNIPQIQADPGQIKSLWCNLVSNAVKYTQPGGDIEISLKTQESWLMGMVRDTGIGIPEEDQDRLFSEFFRARNAKKAGIPGTGLGLVIVKRIVERLGGEVSLESQPGEGTLVCFRIPITKKA